MEIMASAIFGRSSFTFETVRQLVFCFDVLFNFIDMKGMPRFCRCRLFCFAIACWMWSTSLPSAWGQSPVGFSELHFEGTFVILGEDILDTSDLGVLLQETNPDFKNLSKSDGKDVSWDSDGVRYTADSKDLKITWVIDPAFLPYMNGHPTQPFKDKVSIFEIEIIRNKPVPTDLLSKYGFEALGDQVPIYYRLEINGWRINIITDRDRNPEAVTLQHSLSPVLTMLISAPGTPMAELGLDRSTAALGLSRFRLGVSIPRLNIRRIFAGVLLVDPGIPVSDPAEG